MSVEQRVGAVFVFQKKSEVLNDNISVVICLQEPISFVLKARLRDMVVSILEMCSSSSDLERYILDMVVSNSSNFLSNFERDIHYYLKHLVMLIDILESKKSFCPKIVSPLLQVKCNAA